MQQLNTGSTLRTSSFSLQAP